MRVLEVLQAPHREQAAMPLRPVDQMARHVLGLEEIAIAQLARFLTRSVRQQSQHDAAGEGDGQRAASVVSILAAPVCVGPRLVTQRSKAVTQLFTLLVDFPLYVARVFVHWRFS